MSIVPCELCGSPIPFNTYEEHMRLHEEVPEEEMDDEAKEEAEIVQKIPLARTKGRLVISCEVCGEILAYKMYKEHLELHEGRIGRPVPIPGIVLFQYNYVR